MEFLSSFGYSLLFLCIYMRCKSSTFKITGATQMMKAMHKISLSFTSSSQRIAVMERKGKEKTHTSFYPIVFIRTLKDRIVFTDHTWSTPFKYASGLFRVSIEQFIRNFERGREGEASLLTYDSFIEYLRHQ